MNERIEKFIDDAKLTAVCEMFEDELVEFAELIIDQCCKACETATTEDQPLHLVSLGYSQRIKEHFGVK